MSTIKVNSIKNTSTDDGGIAIDNSGHVQVDGVQLPTAGALSNRNLIHNGDQRIDQRNDGSAVTTSSSFPVDRFTISHSSNGAFSAQRSTEAPTGFQYSTKFTTTTADTSITGSQRLLYFTKIEGQNAQHLEFGTANAKSVTLSFWVRSSVTGTFSGSLQNGAQNRSYPYDYTINSADTWEHKTITISGDTTGTWATDNTKSHQIMWSLGISSDYAATANAWVGAQRWGSTTGTANTLGTLNATWYITGVQLEVGEKATPFEHRSYGDELAKCQRYFQKFTGQTGGDYAINGGYTYNNGNAFATGINLSCPLRAQPTLGNATTALRVYGQGTSSNISSIQDIGWAENANCVFIGFALATDIGDVAHAGALTNRANSTFTLDSEL